MTLDQELILIGEAAERLSVSVRTLRFYEQKGLIALQRNTKGQRVLSANDLLHFRKIRKMQECGFALSEIVEVMTSEARFGILISDEVIMRQHRRLLQRRDDIDSQIKALETLKRLG